MYKIDNATSAAAPDAVPVAGVEQYFTEGNPAGAIPATDVPAWWLNMVQDEIRNVVSGAGEVPDKTDNTQLLTAIQALIAAAVGQPIDIPFYAGYDSDGTGKDLAVQAYGAVVMPRNATITGDIGHLRTAATGADLILDIEVNGASIFGTQPKFTAAGTVFTAGVIDGVDDEVVIDVDAGDLVEFKVTQIGSTVAGQRLCYTLKAVTR